MKKMAICCAASMFLLAACGGSGGGNSISTNATETVKQKYSSFQIPNQENEVVETSRSTLNGQTTLREVVAKNYLITIDGKTYKSNQTVDISSLNEGLHTKPFKAQVTLEDRVDGRKAGESVVKSEGDLRLYKQAHSIIVSSYIKKQYDADSKEEVVNEFAIDDIQGKVTPFNQLPSGNKFTYTGDAFTGNTQGKLTYTADFDRKEGYGSISGLQEFGNITLEKAKIKESTDARFKGGAELEGIASSAKLGKGSYGAGFFGPKAEEIAGGVEFTKPAVSDLTEPEDLGIVFGGKR
ncbi:MULTISPECIES: factor H binding protein domain-containing protein [unclassified Neisseria]|uniref:factor H binding protein domain-containing protein n=1 Tax=unclassified Neisseria TaxID=2623750 RepID=UPI0026668464|nr:MULTISPECIES: factor H binding protein domain-containing protein [unclassified Neisseria]MDO1508825.1 factor H binding family protein [Neisseria sp. MVDL19-042950]MDO1515084.1 factor H binding family protein [Neisseria sp. MVDL18-041461]MDO1562444.1 factor H binding family protein [Neisseria sp. MVDL20-010259]